MDFNKELERRIVSTEAIIKKYLPPEAGLQRTVLEAMNYSVNAGGKRLRPILMQETFRLFGGRGEAVEPFMAAIEMIHTYSLVHDDLPAMDNDLYRRGKKTTHAVYGEAMGILAGDGLLNYAFETAAKAFDIELSKRTADALSILANKAGVYGMIGGQVADIESENKEISPQTLEFIHKMKCGALIEGAMMIGAVLAGASAQNINITGQIASDIGWAFQIRDDILDVTGTDEILGKPVGSDNKNHKNTYVTLMGLDSARRDVQHLSQSAVANLDTLPADNAFLRQLLLSLITREK